MAVLVNEDFRSIKKLLYSKPTGKTEMTSKSPSKADWKKLLQELENHWITNTLTRRTAVFAAAGISVNDALADELEKAWMRRRAEGIGGAK